MIVDLQKNFTDLVHNYTPDEAISQKLWAEIREHYSLKNRYYHNLSHLENMLQELFSVKGLIADWDTTLFALYYHDVIYEATSNKNEEKSAELAALRLTEIPLPADKVEKCAFFILATKKHALSSEPDINYFTDTDLAILGQSWETYSRYAKTIRKEYAVYPNILYNAGRKKVLKHFLNQNQIFKTTYFFKKYEIRARENLAKELELL